MATDTIQSLFDKDIHRNINGVIQAGQVDEASIFAELSEYVVTEEISDALALFFTRYINGLTIPTGKMGVWISGFFGSGKSHFLKIVSYVLANQRVYGQSAVEYFHDKHLPGGLLPLLEKASQSQTNTLLFNIDSESSTQGNRPQPIVDVLLKVFNQHLGYSSTSWIAEIERQLAEVGKYEDFCHAFERVTGSPWSRTREFLPVNRTPFLTAAEMIGMSRVDAEFLLSTTRQGLEISSKVLAQRLGNYCRQRGPAYRLVFLIDEVGQYIAGDSRLMLNVQTVVEDIGNMTAGQVWILVTSQEQIDTVADVKAEDFSKIQGRFDTRINLSSINTDEVIKQRLLTKKTWAQQALVSQYDRMAQSLRNMLTFGTQTPGYQVGYASAEEFAASYPCIPYQFDLLQKVFEKVRKQGEAGKHLAHGERSLLNAFQEAVHAIGADALGRLVPLSAFYDTIESFLDSGIKNTIRKAARRTRMNARDIAVLKVLYLIKNLPEMPATAENVTTLLVDQINTVKAELARGVHEALDRLVEEQLVQVNADRSYTFLSDEEQEVNREIQHSQLKPGDVEQQIGSVLFHTILDGQDKFRQGHRDFPFVRRFEDRNFGSLTGDLTVHCRLNTESTEPRVQFEAHDHPGTLFIVIPPGDYQDSFSRAKRIQRYLIETMGVTTDPSRLRILQQKQLEAPTFEEHGETELRQALLHAAFFVQGQPFHAVGDFKAQWAEAMKKLIQNTYPKLEYITHPLDPKSAPNQLKQWARYGQPSDMLGVNDLALEETMRFLEDKARRYARVSVKELRDYFSRPPYGWFDGDVAGLVALLLGMQRIRLTYAQEALTAEDPQLPDRLLRGSEQAQVIVDLIVSMPAEDHRRVAKLLREQFGYPRILGDSVDAVATTIRQVLITQWGDPLDAIKTLQQHGDPSYPYPGAALIHQLEVDWGGLPIGRGGQALVNAFLDREESWAEDVDRLEKLQAFYDKSPRKRFDEAVALLNSVEQDVKLAMNAAPVQSLYQRIQSILRMDDPSLRIPDLPGLCHQLSAALRSTVAEERARYQSQMEAVLREIDRIEQEHPERDQSLRDKIHDIRNTIEAFTQAANLTIMLAHVPRVNQGLAEIRRLLTPPLEDPDPSITDPVTFRQILRTSVGELPVQIQSRDELANYLEVIKTRCWEILEKHGVIIIDPTEAS